MWQRGDRFPLGYAPWKQLFKRLRDVRPWGPGDRVRSIDQSLLRDAVQGAAPGDMIRLECELVFQKVLPKAQEAREAVSFAIRNAGGSIISAARYEAFSYDAILIDMPANEVARIADLDGDTLAGLDPILSIMPQGMNSSTDVGESELIDDLIEDAANKSPIAAVFDAVPLASHPWLSDWLSVSDPYGLEDISVGARVHGTAMASIVVHGDRNQGSTAIGRKLYFRSVMYAPAPDEFGMAQERFQDDRLIIDLMVEAVITMREEGFDQVVIVNISLGDANKQYRGRLSAWARAIDYLSYKYGILFIVSSGNIGNSLEVGTHVHPDQFHDADVDDKKAAIFKAIDAVKSDRRILAPAESVNALTVGAWHSDSLAEMVLPDRRYRAYPDCNMPNISSALGLGHKGSIKPDILLPGGREHIILSPASPPVSVRPQGQGTRFGGIRVAAPPVPGQPNNSSAWIIGSSPAAAYASHTAHHLYETLENEYGALYTDLTNHQKAAILKALVAHSASWQGADEFITNTKFPIPVNWDQMRREVARHLGYGFVLPNQAINCAADRATMWAAGRLLPLQALKFKIPIPNDFTRTNTIRSVRATLAWLSPVRPGHQAYRTSKLRILPLSDDAKNALGVSTTKEPPWTQTEAGTLIHRQWAGQSFGHLAADGTLSIQVQREKDQGPALDDAIPFGLAVSVIMDDNEAIYDEILNRVAIRPRSRVLIS